jgi:hypothetical protein
MGTVKVIARLIGNKKQRLYHVLLDEGITPFDGLRKQIESYRKEKKPKRSRREG